MHNTVWGEGSGPIDQSISAEIAPCRTLIAIGGGGFGGSAALGGIETALVTMLNGRNPQNTPPTILFLPTASGDSADYIERFKSCSTEFGFEPSVLSLFNPSQRDSSPAELISAADLIYVGGGNTFNMLTLWREWGIVPLLKLAYMQGTILAGVSAGAICWFAQGNTDSLGPKLQVLDGLGWIPGSCTPHFHGEANRVPTLQNQIQEGKIMPGIALDDHCFAVYKNEKFDSVHHETPGAFGYWVTGTAPYFSQIPRS